MKKREVVWKGRWEKTLREETPTLFSLWDFVYELTYTFLMKEGVAAVGKVCLEAGSGSGRLSLKLAETGALPILLDVSREAIKFSKLLAQVKRLNADFVVGSILSLPLKSSCLDAVWNEGVLEHFVRKEQELIVRELLRVLKTNGKLIAIVPNRRASFYNFFRVLSMKVKKWPYGYEEPFLVEDFDKFSPKPVALHSFGWIFSQFNTISIPRITQVTRMIIRGLALILKSWFITIERKSPGQYLAAVWVK